MTGRIENTNRRGGFVKSDTGERLEFRWADCRGIGPRDIGHDCRVEFAHLIRGKRKLAIGLQREGT